jgi:hypothetical protein
MLPASGILSAITQLTGGGGDTSGRSAIILLTDGEVCDHHEISFDGAAGGLLT